MILHEPLLEYIASKYPKAWLYLAKLHEENDNIDQSINCYKEFLKLDVHDSEKKSIWKKLADIYKNRNEYLYEVNALVEKASLPNTAAFEISEIANITNKYFQNGLLNIDSDVKERLVQRLIDIFDSKSSSENFDATDYSRLAWLYLNNRNPKLARETIIKGLRIDDLNPHCQKLAQKLDINIS